MANPLNQLRHCSKPIVRLSLISIPAPTSTEHTLFTRQHTAYLPALKLRYVRPSLTSVCLEDGKRTLEKRTWSRAVVPSLSGKPRLHGDVTHRREARPAPSRPQTLLVLSFMVLLHCNNILNAYNLTILLGSYFGRLTGPVPRRYEGNRSMDPPGVCELGNGLQKNNPSHSQCLPCDRFMIRTPRPLHTRASPATRFVRCRGPGLSRSRTSPTQIFSHDRTLW